MPRINRQVNPVEIRNHSMPSSMRFLGGVQAMRLLLLSLAFCTCLLPALPSTLTTAINKGEQTKAIDIIKRDPAEVNIADIHGFYPVHLAVVAGEVALLQAIIDAGANVEIFSPEVMNPLMYALYEGNMDIIKLLIDKGANIQVRDESGQSVLALIADVDIARFLIEKGAPLNVADHSGVTPLMRAMHENNPGLVKLLAERGADFAARDNDKKTLLHYAASSGNLYLVMMSIAMKGGNAQDIDEYGKSPLHVLYLSPALSYDTDDDEKFAQVQQALQLFNEQQLAEIHQELGEDIPDMFLAISRILLNRNANINLQDEDGNSPLLLAASTGNPDMVRFLIDNGADLKVRSDNGETILHKAVFAENLRVMELVKYLVSEGCPTNLTDDDGYTLLQLAVAMHGGLLVDYLLTLKPDVNAVNHKGKTALMVAVTITDEREFIIKLLDRGANLDFQGADGDSALHLAAARNNYLIVSFLLEKGAKWDLRNYFGQTVIDVALMHNASDSLKLICQKAGVPVPTLPK